jgi:His/Glu/Gln/Arg/opine family amino acid ABC transporter permease subunit
MIMDLATALSYLPSLVDGAVSTLQLTLLTLVFGFLVAAPIALLRNARNGFARATAIGFVFFFRGTPLLALLFFIYYGAPDVPLIRDTWAWNLFSEPYPVAVLALSLNSAGYLTEILAGAIRGVPRGEVEAAEAAGFGRFETIRRIIVPNAARLALRSYGNEVVFVIKSTSVASLVTILELLGVAQKIYFNTFDPITPFLAAGAIYLAMVFLLLLGVRAAERRLVPELRVAGVARRSTPPWLSAASP